LFPASSTLQRDPLPRRIRSAPADTSSDNASHSPWPDPAAVSSAGLDDCDAHPRTANPHAIRWSARRSFSPGLKKNRIATCPAPAIHHRAPHERESNIACETASKRGETPPRSAAKSPRPKRRRFGSAAANCPLRLPPSGAASGSRMSRAWNGGGHSCITRITCRWCGGFRSRTFPGAPGSFRF